MNIKETLKVIFSVVVLIGLMLFSNNFVQAQADPTPIPTLAAPPPGYERAPDPTEREGGLTDEEFLKSKERHEGYIDRETQRLCTGNENTCIGEKDNEDKFLGMNPGLVEAVGQAYGMIIGTVGGDFEKKPEVGADGKPKELKKGAKEEDKEVSDYCKYIALGTETISTFKQQQEQKLITDAPATDSSFQKEQLYRAGRTHEARAETAKIQTYGWGATTACYTYMMVGGGITVDWKVIAKTAAAGFLTYFYSTRIGAYEDQAAKIKELADQVPGDGDCNAITQRNCYCMQPETHNDPEYCVPRPIPGRKLVENADQTTCLDKELKSDPQCTCLASDSCFDQQFYSDIGGVNFGKNFQQNVVKPVQNLSRGNIPNSALSRTSLSGLAASTKQNLNKFKDEINEIPQVPSKNKAVELELTKAGIPSNIARRIASAPTGSAAKSAVAKIRSGIQSSNKALQYQKASGKVVYFGGQKKTESRRKSSNDFDFLKNLRKKKKKKKHKPNVINFANKAQQKAQISRKTRNIFQLISRRYKVSAERRLK